MSKSDNPPAFPNDARTQLGDDYQGMTLRDYFAGQALVGITAGRGAAYSTSYDAQKAYQAADAMLKARGDA